MRDEQDRFVGAKAGAKTKTKPKLKLKPKVEIELKPKVKAKVKAKVTPTLATYVKPKSKPKPDYGKCVSCDMPRVSLMFDSKAKKPQYAIVCDNRACSMYRFAVKWQ